MSKFLTEIRKDFSYLPPNIEYGQTIDIGDTVTMRFIKKYNNEIVTTIFDIKNERQKDILIGHSVYNNRIFELILN